MTNLIKQGSSLVINGDVKTYPFKNGKISLPLNSLYFVIDESNVISFKQAIDNNTILSININDLQINGEQVTKENLIEKFDAVANGNSSGGGSGSGIPDAPSDGKLYGRKNANWSEVIIPDTSSFVTDSELDAKGYKKIEYLTQSQYDELPNKEEGVMYVITDAPEVVIPDISTLATKEEISDMLTKTEASTTYALQSALQAALDRIAALEVQVGNVASQLDNINGEVIN